MVDKNTRQMINVLMLLNIFLLLIGVCSGFAGNHAPQMCMQTGLGSKSCAPRHRSGRFNRPNGMSSQTTLKLMEGNPVPHEVTWPTREHNSESDTFDWGSLEGKQIFHKKRVVVFSLPGAFTPTCSTTHLPGYENLYNDIKDQGVDEVYCLSVNDPFVMNAWKKSMNIEKVRMIPDGNAHFTKAAGMLVDKGNLGFGPRSWRYSMVVNDGVVEKLFVEDDQRDLADNDPFTVSDADTVLEYLKSVPR